MDLISSVGHTGALLGSGHWRRPAGTLTSERDYLPTPTNREAVQVLVTPPAKGGRSNTWSVVTLDGARRD